MMSSPPGIGTVESPGLLRCLLAMVTQPDITEAILLGVREGMLTLPQLSKLLEASPTMVEIRKDIIIAAASPQFIAIPTMDQSEPILGHSSGQRVQTQVQGCME